MSHEPEFLPLGMSQAELIGHRNSYMKMGEVFFWTATINQWQHLLREDSYKDIIIKSLGYLSSQRKIDVYAFVIMPNHIHLIWRTNELNGKETPQGSFLKYTAQEYRKLLSRDGKLSTYKVDASNKKHEIWQRDSLAIHLYSREVALQKLKYIHSNPLTEHWQLANHPCDYRYSSAVYYEMNKKDFLFLKDLWEVF